MTKSYKREVAAVMLAVLYVFGSFAAMGWGQSLDVVKILSVPTFLAVGGAFGLHSLATQMKDPLQ